MPKNQIILKTIFHLVTSTMSAYNTAPVVTKCSASMASNLCFAHKLLKLCSHPAVEAYDAPIPSFNLHGIQPTSQIKSSFGSENLL